MVIRRFVLMVCFFCATVNRKHDYSKLGEDSDSVNDDNGDDLPLQSQSRKIKKKMELPPPPAVPAMTTQIIAKSSSNTLASKNAARSTAMQPALTQQPADPPDLTRQETPMRDAGGHVSSDVLKAMLTCQTELKQAIRDVQKQQELHTRMLQELLHQKDMTDDTILDTLGLPLDNREELKTLERTLRDDKLIYGKVVSILYLYPKESLMHYMNNVI